MNDITCFGSRSIFYLTLHDLRGNKTYEGGATYPVRYTYDVFGNKTSMTTYRNEASGIGDTTTWTYDEASGVLLAKTYADGKGLTYTYTNDGRLATRTNARGIVTTYTYDDWGQPLSVDYADTTPDIAYTYDAMGRQTSATDAVGTTAFTHDAVGQLTAEQVSGLYSKTLTRHWDNFGRTVGYSVDGERKQSITYDSVTGRLDTMGDFAWEYLPGSHLKSRLTYPNDATAVWEYEPKRDLLARVTNTINGAVASQYDYVNDLLGRRIEIGKSGSMMDADETQPYGYNVRDELISGQNQTYAYDDIGNRTTAEGKTYTANNLNQYTKIDDFVPKYDADGNQTLIKTETGVWSVVYNAENRPVRWESGDTVITMSFDRMGRRVDYFEMRAGQVTTHFRFVYDNFLCIQRLDVANGNAVRTEFVWDPTEPIATRPLVMCAKNWDLNLFYTHDGNKNVSEVFYHALQNGIAAHYDYAPFGAVTSTARATHVTNRDLLSENPFRFSSEYHDGTFGLIYYNYRHYIPEDARWSCLDPAYNKRNEYLFIQNDSLCRIDSLGLLTVSWAAKSPENVSAPLLLPSPSIENIPVCCGATEYDPQTQCCRFAEKVVETKYLLCIYVIQQGKMSYGHAWAEMTNLRTGEQTSYGQRRRDHVAPKLECMHYKKGLYINYEIEYYGDRRENDPGIVKKCTTICGFEKPVARDYSLLGGGNCADVAEDIWFENTGERLTNPMVLPRRPSLLKRAITERPPVEEPESSFFWL